MDEDIIRIILFGILGFTLGMNKIYPNKVSWWAIVLTACAIDQLIN